jgi:hypothetical protein
MEYTDPERRLVAAILTRAVRDAVDDNEHTTEARQWLTESEYAEILFSEMGIHLDVVETWVDTLEPLLQPELPGIFSGNDF